MNIKPISQKSFDKLLHLQDRQLDSKLEWLNHTSYCEALEVAGRLHYKFKVSIAPRKASIIEVATTVPLDGEYRKILELI